MDINQRKKLVKMFTKEFNAHLENHTEYLIESILDDMTDTASGYENTSNAEFFDDCGALKDECLDFLKDYLNGYLEEIKIKVTIPQIRVLP